MGVQILTGTVCACIISNLTNFENPGWVSCPAKLAKMDCLEFYTTTILVKVYYLETLLNSGSLSSVKAK